MQLSRRDFIKGLVAVGSASVFLAGYSETVDRLVKPRYTEVKPDSVGRIVHSACLGCNVRCGIRVNVVQRGGMEVVERISGNPYHVYNRYVSKEKQSRRYEPLPYNTPITEGLKYSGTLCARGEDGIHYLYDPYRIIVPLKRAGPRGSGKFKPITWEQLINEVVNGGVIEETGERLPGLKELFAYGILSEAGFDANAVLSEMKKDVDAIMEIAKDDTKSYGELTEAINNFKAKWSAKLGEKGLKLEDILIDPDRPDLGTKANQLVYMRGRGQGHADYFYQRWTYAFGSVNWLRHTSSCQLGYYAGNKIWSGYHDVQADPIGAKLLLMVGAQMGRLHPGATGQGLIVERAAEGELKVYYVNPTAPRTTANGNIVWVPIRPGTDAAFAMALLRVMLERGYYDAEFLSYANTDAARKAGYPLNTNASWLVIWEGDRKGEFLKGEDIGLGSDNPVVYAGSFVTNDSVEKAEIFFDGYVETKEGRRRVKSALQILKEECFSKSVEEWCEICGVDVAVIYEIAEEIRKAMPNCGTIVHRGAGMHTNGEYNVWALRCIDMLIGNIHRKGGLMTRASHTNYNKELYYVDKSKFGEPVRWGPPIDRHKVAYEDSLEYWMKKKRGENPYPAKRPWYPLTPEESYTEMFAGIAEEYPYPIKALIMYYANPVLSANFGVRFMEVLRDTSKLPLFVAITTSINETFLYADYIVPDTMYLETGTMGINYLYATSASVTLAEYWRSPAVMPLTQLVGTCPNGHPKYASMWEFLIDIALKLKMPGYGKGAVKGVGAYDGQKFDLYCAWEYIMYVFANAAMDAKKRGLIPETVSDEEVDFVEKNYPIARFKDIVPNEWRYVAYGLARGGVFTRYEDSFDEREYSKRTPWTDTVYFWSEKLAKARNSVTGEKFYGGPKYLLPATYAPLGTERRFYGTPLREIYPESQYPFLVVPPGSPLFTKHRSMFYYWLKQVMPENFAVVNPEDAEKLGIESGDVIKITTPTGELEVVAAVEPTVVKGTIAIPVGMGRWADSAVKKPAYFSLNDGSVAALVSELPEGASLPSDAVNPVKQLDETKKRILFTKSDRRYYDDLGIDSWRFSGVTPNVVACVDKSLDNWPLLSWIGAAQVYFFIPARVEKTGKRKKFEMPNVWW
ncbi:MAG: Tetrathionate reductase subunit A [Archaeoglobus fulgidus]|uniref:Tetrathionate reductase subunit A n=1 Tax=Archaeoglobus fulgidus TaxID=2234 RepID=A0A117KU14_ARCFL|nr:tetrathionate reductase subunit A [Archaeoglobus fulgidus]KUJ93423.1 MAG: Tetrathionate reductase subunit A [Archaeoglobus fulgidus]KUK05951.1 MAG: Tetrathionate reductase subunit A [Archaeoglobus fulgidus]